MRKVSGFTLIELLITVVIVVILVTIAIPTFGRLITSQNVSSQANEVLSGIRAARSEALRRNEAVQVNPNGDWTTGFTVDLVSGGETTRAFNEFGSGLTFDDNNGGSAPGAAALAFDASGTLSSMVTIGMEPAGCSSGTEDRRVITVLVSGNSRIETESC